MAMSVSRHPGCRVPGKTFFPRLLRLRLSWTVDTAATGAGHRPGLQLSGCALIGGEGCRMPSMYPDGEYDLAGFAVGTRGQVKIIDGSTGPPGDVVLGLASAVPLNGYSLIRKIIRSASPAWKRLPWPQLKSVIMEPTHLYVKSMLA